MPKDDDEIKVPVDPMADPTDETYGAGMLPRESLAAIESRLVEAQADRDWWLSVVRDPRVKRILDHYTDDHHDLEALVKADTSKDLVAAQALVKARRQLRREMVSTPFSERIRVLTERAHTLRKQVPLFTRPSLVKPQPAVEEKRSPAEPTQQEVDAARAAMEADPFGDMPQPEAGEFGGAREDAKAAPRRTRKAKEA